MCIKTIFTRILKPRFSNRNSLFKLNICYPPGSHKSTNKNSLSTLKFSLLYNIEINFNYVLFHMFPICQIYSFILKMKLIQSSKNNSDKKGMSKYFCIKNKFFYITHHNNDFN